MVFRRMKCHHRGDPSRLGETMLIAEIVCPKGISKFSSAKEVQVSLLVQVAHDVRPIHPSVDPFIRRSSKPPSVNTTLGLL